MIPARPLLALGLASLAACASAQDGPPPPPGPDWDMIAFEVKSWGVPIVQWQFSPQYGGVWTEATHAEGAPFGDYTLEFHALEADVDRYIALERLMRTLPTPAPESDQCENFMTDQPYGTLRLTRGATTTEIAWNAGCMDDHYVAFMAPLREADQLVRSWGEAVPVTRTESR
ncbi:MAG: hypothetical protein KDE15_05915 [Erythrobacter sp.]|nr:hypothetical protein [Erythrobacter sp.]